jgi:hypothetical protein
VRQIRFSDCGGGVFLTPPCQAARAADRNHIPTVPLSDGFKLPLLVLDGLGFLYGYSILI